MSPPKVELEVYPMRVNGVDHNHLMLRKMKNMAMSAIMLSVSDDLINGVAEIKDQGDV